MRVAIIGAGIIGVTTAYELSSDGHEVTVFERRGSVAAETSFANAGLVAPGYVTPWAAPGMPAKVARGLFSRHSPVRLAGLDAATMRWIWRWWRACGTATYQANRLRMQRLAYFSRERLHDVSRRLRLDYERSDGYLVLLRSAKDLALAQPGLATLTALGTRHQILDADGCRRVEPGLCDATPLHAGIHLPDDEVGNCRQFAHLLRREAEQLGARFRFDTAVQRIVPGERPQLVHLHTLPADAQSRLEVSRDRSGFAWAVTRPLPSEPVAETFDAVVVCAAMGAVGLLRPLGLRLPLQAVHGYSLTAPLRVDERHPQIGPRSALMDERYKVAISRFGTRVRVAGSAELGGSLDRHSPRALATLYKVLHDWFPGAAPLAPGAALERRAADAARRPAGARRQRHRRRLAQPRPWLERLGPVLRLGPPARRRAERPRRRQSTPTGWGSSGCATEGTTGGPSRTARCRRSRWRDPGEREQAAVASASRVAARAGCRCTTIRHRPIERSAHATHRLHAAVRAAVRRRRTRAQIERRASAGLPPHALMRRAGESVARLALALAPHARRIWIAAGPGNNGGDGLEAASRLRQWGKAVEVQLRRRSRCAAGRRARRAGARAAGRRRDRHRAGRLPCPSRDAGPRDRRAARHRRDPGTRTARWPTRSTPQRRRLSACSRSTCRRVCSPTPVSRSARPASSPTHTLALLTLKPGLFTGERPRPCRQRLVRRPRRRRSRRRSREAWLVGSGGAARRAAPACAAQGQLRRRRGRRRRARHGRRGAAGGARGARGRRRQRATSRCSARATR